MVGPFDLPLSMILLLAGTVLMVLEALAPGAHFVVVGVALLVAGLVGLALGSLLGPLTPLVLALVVVLSGAASLWLYREFDFYGGKGSGRTSDSGSLRGTTGRVTERITDEGGEVKLEGGGFNPYYRARSVMGEIPVGEEVIVVDPGGGNVVTVESLGAVEDDEIDRALARDRSEGEPAPADDGGEETEAPADGEADERRDRDDDSETETA